ncbi:MAG: SDR family NAD(P)-dependent oxidoreductase [Alphaproteobacteria bacterium]
MDLGLKGRKAAITGGTRGIGRAIAELLADEGCDIAICARGEDAIGPTVEALKAKGVKATGGAADVRDGQAMTDWAAAAADTLGGIDILIANASGFGVTLDDAGWREGYEVDIMGTFHAVEAVMPALEKSDAGAIVAISSIAAVESSGSVRPYNAVKAAVIAYVSNLAGALASRNIRANCVSPGTIYFEGGVWHQRELDAPEIYQGALAKNPMGRMGSAEEVANAAVFLASPAASFVTGTNLIVDGAFTNRVQF